MHESRGRHDVVIIGGGPAGLTAALEMQRRTGLRPIVFEADQQVGGISKTIQYRGNRMDLGGHRFFSKSTWVVDWWQSVMPVAPECAPEPEAANQWPFNRPVRYAQPGDGDVLLVRNRLSRILYRRRFYDYPISLSTQTLRNLGAPASAAICASYLRARLAPRTPEATLQDFLINRFGERLYLTFFKSYTEKVWGVPCTDISAEWGAQRIKGVSIAKALAHAARAVAPRLFARDGAPFETSLIERFLYPRLGPGHLWEVVSRNVVAAGGEVHLGHRVVNVVLEGSRAVAVDAMDPSGATRRVPCDALVSSMPIGELVGALRPPSPEIAAIGAALPHRDFMTAGLLLRRLSTPGRPREASTVLPKDNWIYVQEDDVRLGRIQIFNNWSPDLVRDPDTVWLGLEYFCNQGDDLWSRSDGEFLDFAARELEQIGFADRRDVLDGAVVRVPKAYPAYFGEYRHIDRVREWLDGFDNVFTIGRNGMHRYNNQDHSMLAARAAVDCLASGNHDRRALWSVNTEEDYHEGGPPTSEAART